MSRFLQYLLIGLALPTLLCLAIVEFGARHCPNTYRFKHNAVMQHGGDITTLVLGGSRAYYGIDPALLSEQAFSLANVSQPLYIDYWLLRKYHAALPKLGIVILDVNNVNIASSGDMGKGMEWYRLIYYTLYMDYPAPLLSRYHFEVCNFCNAKKKAMQAARNANATKVEPTCTTAGWGLDYVTPKEYDPAAFAENALIAAKRHNHPGQSRFEHSVQKLEEIAAYCKEHNLRLILITTPLSPEYRAAANPEQFQYLTEATRRMAEKYGVEYLNYAGDPRFRETDFYDGDHLSHQGTRKFSEILKSDAKL